jgi:hypothetical protein
MQPQPPPDMSAPLPSAHALRSQRIRNAIWICGIFSVLFVLTAPMFYAKINRTNKPDGIFTKGQALSTGECGFTYLRGAKITDNLERPLLVTPMIPGTDRFDPKPFKGKAVVLKLDYSVTSLPIDKDGHLMINGRNLMDPNHPIWGGHPPVIAWPDL